MQLCSTLPPKSSDLKWWFIVCHNSVCSSSSASLARAHLYNDAQLANWVEFGLLLAARWAEPLGLCLLFHPRLLCSMRISGQRSRRGSLSVGALIQPLPLVFAAVLLAKADLMAKSESVWKRNATGVAIKSMANRGCCCKNLPNSPLQHFLSSVST